MNSKQKNYYWGKSGRIKFGWLVTLLVLLQSGLLLASEKAIESIQFSTLAGNKVQLELGMNSQAIEPKIFQTDNPARIALDFLGVKSDLAKKSFPVNQGAANTVYVLEVGNRTRVILNLIDSVNYKTRTEGNKFYVILDAAKSIASTEKVVKKQLKQNNVSRLLPRQTIKSVDFRRGSDGEGRLLLALSNPNTVVDIKERGGKVVLNFLNTKIPDSLAKRYDVIDFATPVQIVDAVKRGNGTVITVTTVDGNYDYSSFQSKGLLTVEFRPLSSAEKAAQIKDKFPFTGDKLSLNFQDIPVRNVVAILADFTNLNIIIPDSVDSEGNVTLRLNDVPWDQALDIILKSKSLGKRVSGNVINIAPIDEIIKREAKEEKSRKSAQRLEPLKTEYIQINYANASNICSMLYGQSPRGSAGVGASSGRSASGGSSSGGCSNRRRSSGGSGSSGGLNRQGQGLISSRGAVMVDPRTNRLIIMDAANRLEEIHKLVKVLDIPIRQVMIESRIVIASTDFTRKLGVQFGTAQNNSNTGSGNSFTLGAGTASTSSLVDLTNALAATSGGALAMTLARGANYILNLELTAAQTNNQAEVLSNPRIMTSNLVKATIKQGVQIPFQTTSQNGPVTQLVDAVLQLDVTPQITPNGSVIMNLDIKKDAPGVVQQTGFGSAVQIDKKQVKTIVQVNDGETVVLGGIYEGTTTNNNAKIPWFGDLPGIGWMFTQKKDKDLKKSELLIFVTPKIIKNTLAVN